LEFHGVGNIEVAFLGSQKFSIYHLFFSKLSDIGFSDEFAGKLISFDSLSF